MRDLHVVKNHVRVTLEHIGEGIHGDYDPEDSNDVPLVRFTVYCCRPMWEQVDDGSYCTTIDCRTDRNKLRRFARKVLNSVYETVVAGGSIKRVCEDLSWGDVEP